MTRDPLENRANKVTRVWLDNKDHEEIPERMVFPATLATLGHLDLQVTVVLLAPLDLEASKACQGPLARMDKLAGMERPVSRVLLV